MSCATLAPRPSRSTAAAAAGISSEATAWGAQLFFWARVAHAAIYIAGIPYVRALAFVASLSGMFDIAAELLRSP